MHDHGEAMGTAHRLYTTMTLLPPIFFKPYLFLVTIGGLPDLVQLRQEAEHDHQYTEASP